MRKYSALPAVLLAVAALTGCGNEPDFPNTLLTTVPANTAYVFASGEPLPESFTERLLEAYRPMMEDMESQMQRTFTALEKENPEAARRLRGLMTEFMQLAMADDGLEQMGLSRDDRYVIYGNGLLPVARITVSDPEAFRAFIDRLLQAGGVKPATNEHAGAAYWRVDVGQMVVVAGLDEGVFSMAVTPAGDQNATLDYLFSDQGMAGSMADNGVIAALVEEYDFAPSGTGYVDIVRITELLLGAAGEESGLLAKLGKASPEVSNECRKEILTMAARVPRVVFGYDQLTDDHIATRGIIELDPALAVELQSWTEPVPGLGTDSDALVMFGYSLNGIKAAESIRNWMQAMGQRDFACAALGEKPWALAGGFNAAPLYGLGNPKGLVFRLGELEIKSLEPVDFDIQASVVMLLDNPQVLPARVQIFIPQLQTLEIPSDGSLVSVRDLIAAPEELTKQIDEEIFVAMTDRLLGLSAGADGAERLGAAMSAETAEHPPFIQLHLDAGWLYATLAEWMPKLAALDDDAEPTSRGSLERQVEMMRAYSELFDKLSYRIGFTDQGIEFVSDVTLQ